MSNSSLNEDPLVARGAAPGAAKARSCNQHEDCDSADAKAAKAGKRRPHHCRIEDCEDCFGCSRE
jgi:hypothetical protein